MTLQLCFYYMVSEFGIIVMLKKETVANQILPGGPKSPTPLAEVQPEPDRAYFMCYRWL